MFKAGMKSHAAFRGISGSDILIQMISGAEAQICSEARYNFIENYNSLNGQTRLLLDDAVSSYVANLMIAYDMSVFTSRVEAESMINLHTNIWNSTKALVKEKKVTDFIINGSSQ